MTDLEEGLAEIVDDLDFQSIDRRFGRFNLFEAMGAVRREIEHSNFLGFLLSPDRPHGLGTEPLRRVLRAFLERVPRETRQVRALEVVVGELGEAVVHREQDYIDLLIEVAELKLVVAIENKVGAKAGNGQLARYKDTVRRKYLLWRHLFVFLTPEGVDPVDPDYVAFSYLDLAKIIENLVADNDASNSGEVTLILRHYLEMLRRHVVPDEELRELALRIYERHREALDFIFECRPEPGSLLGVVRELISKRNDLLPDRQVNSIARFIPEQWRDIPGLNKCPKDVWTKTGRNVIFEVKSFKTEANDFSDRILLSLILGPSTPEFRKRMFARAREQPQIFTGASSTVNRHWATIFSCELLSKAAAKNMSEEKKIEALTDSWNTFTESSLAVLTRAIIEIAAKEIPAEQVEHKAKKVSNAMSGTADDLVYLGKVIHEGEVAKAEAERLPPSMAGEASDITMLGPVLHDGESEEGDRRNRFIGDAASVAPLGIVIHDGTTRDETKK